MYPAYNPTVLFTRPAPLSSIQKSAGGPSPFYDNRLVVTDASGNGGVRGYALPLPLALARRTSLLHDDEISGATLDEAADAMMNAATRSPKAAHPFFVASASGRATLIEFMKSLTVSSPAFTAAGVANASQLDERRSDSGRSDRDLRRRRRRAQRGVHHSRQLHASRCRQWPGRGIDQDGSVNGPNSPAPKGSVIAPFTTGLGQTSPAGVTGQIGSAPLPKILVSVSATIDGHNAPVAYAGGAVGLLSGVSQVNLVVPTGAGTGNVAISLNAAGAISQAGVTVWLK